MKTFYGMLRGKVVRIVYHVRPSNPLRETGEFVHGNDSFVVIKNREGRVQFIRSDSIVQIRELNQQPKHRY